MLFEFSQNLISNFIKILIFLPLITFIINGIIGKKIPSKFVSFLGVSSVFLSFILSIFCFLYLIKNPSPINVSIYEWLKSGSIHIDISFYIDSLSMIMILIVTGVGAFIHLYSVGYMRGDKGYYRYFSYLNLFTFFMLILVSAKNFLLMFVGWEGVGLCSYLLIGFWFEDMEKAKAGKKAFIVNRIGDAGFLLALLIILFILNGSLDIQEFKIYVENNSQSFFSSITVTLLCFLLFLGATGKSAQIPLYIWLPDAMAGPTPVSALIHAATMVTAGVYMISRLSFLYILSPFAMDVIAFLGAITAFYSATIGLLQNDIKKVLAYSTISQLGYMFLAVGIGAFSSSIFHLMTHAFFKACLFLSAGSVIHALGGEHDIRKMGGLWRKMPITNLTFLIATLSISGFPLFAGFFSKDEILFKTFSLTHKHGFYLNSGLFLFMIALFTSLLTSIYMFRLYFLTFCGRKNYEAKPHESPPSMTIPLLFLAFGSIFSGYVHIPFEKFLKPCFSFSLNFLEEKPTHLTKFSIIFISSIIAIAGILITYIFYIKEKTLPQKIALKMQGLYRIIYNKYYVDEIYGFLFVRPLRNIAHFLFRFMDTIVIDGFFVNGSAFVFKIVSATVRKIQNGDVQRYIVAIILGFAVLIYYLF